MTRNLINPEGSLLELLRTRYGFNNNGIKRILKENLYPITDVSANEVEELVNSLIDWANCCENTELATKIKHMATAIKQNEDISNCNDCNTSEYYESLHSCYEGDRYVCDSCIDNYRWSDYRDTYVAEDDYEDEPDEDQEQYEGVYDYYHRVEDDLGMLAMPYEKLNKDTIFYGVELEVERRNNCPYEITSRINEEVLSGFAQCKSDGSLDNGFEITTTPATFLKQKQQWERFFKDKECMESLKGWNTDTAGLHIHISRSALRLTDIGKLLVFINDDDNTEFIKQVAGRSSEQWAKRTPKKITDSLRSSEKYESVNMAHSKTIELRIFKSNISRNGFYRVLEFTDSLVYFVKNYASLTGLSLHYKSYLKYISNPAIRGQYPNLTAWLIRKGYLSGRPSRQVSWQGEQIDTATN